VIRNDRRILQKVKGLMVGGKYKHMKRRRSAARQRSMAFPHNPHHHFGRNILLYGTLTCSDRREIESIPGQSMNFSGNHQELPNSSHLSICRIWLNDQQYAHPGRFRELAWRLWERKVLNIFRDLDRSRGIAFLRFHGE
jgi:hypothetical protein